MELVQDGQMEVEVETWVPGPAWQPQAWATGVQSAIAGTFKGTRGRLSGTEN
jgi:hypothetical protein